MTGFAGVIGRVATDDRRQTVDRMLAALTYGKRTVSARFADEERRVTVGCVSPEGQLANLRSDRSGMLTLVWAGDVLPGERLIAEGCAPTAGATVDEFLQRYPAHPTTDAGAFEGIFCGVLIDRRQHVTHLFTDAHGLGRLYYHATPTALYFSSEAKAILAVITAARGFDEHALEEYLRFGAVPLGRTLFNGVAVLPADAWWSVRPDGSLSAKRQCRRHASAAESTSSQSASAPDDRRTFGELLRDALPKYLGGGRQVGLSLTGGLDTRVIAALWPAGGPTPVTYTFDGVDGTTLDTDIAARVAAIQGWRHTVLRLGADFFRDFDQRVEETVVATDGALGATGAHEVYLNRLAAQLADIRLTGNFGSELFRGASAFSPLKIERRLFSSAWRTRLQLSPAPRPAPSVAAVLEEIPRFHFGTLAASSTQVLFRSPYLDTVLSAFISDARGAEINTDRFWAVVRGASPTLAAVRTDRGRHGGTHSFVDRLRCVSREVTFKADYVYNEGGPLGLPKVTAIAAPVLRACGMIHRHKYLHYSHWFRGELREYVRAVLASDEVRHSPLWNHAHVGALDGAHQRGWANRVAELNLVITLATIERLLFRAPAFTDESLGHQNSRWASVDGASRADVCHRR